jgi:hypothetical protein
MAKFNYRIIGMSETDSAEVVRDIKTILLDKSLEDKLNEYSANLTLIENKLEYKVVVDAPYYSLAVFAVNALSLALYEKFSDKYEYGKYLYIHLLLERKF